MSKEIDRATYLIYQGDRVFIVDRKEWESSWQNWWKRTQS